MTPTEYKQLVDFLAQRFTEADRHFTEVDRRLAGLGQDITDLRRDMLGHFDEVYRRLDRLEQEDQAITQTLRRIEPVACR